MRIGGRQMIGVEFFPRLSSHVGIYGRPSVILYLIIVLLTRLMFFLPSILQWMYFLRLIAWRGGLSDRESCGAVMETPWSLPPSPFIKVNVDASWAASSGHGFVGIVARDST